MAPPRKLNRTPGYTQFEWQNKEKPAELLDFEQKTGLVLPDGYRRFMLEYNGGVFDESVFLDTPEGPVVVAVFLPFSSTESASVNRAYAYFQANGFPGLIPFGSDPGGNYFLLGWVKSSLDTVYYWNHETRQTIKIAEGFECFINALVRDD